MTPLTLFFLHCLIFAKPGTETDLVAQKIDALLTQYHLNHEFNGSVLVAQKGQVIYKKGFGLANVEWQIPNSPDTRFRLASLTKQFTAMVVLQLVQEGKLKLEDTISDYLPFYRADTGSKITIHHLLCHTSGIPSYGRDKVFMQKKARNPVEIQDFIKERCSDDLEFVPGSQFKYSNSGYYILGALIEVVTGQTYAQVVQSRIFTPLDMHNSGYDDRQTIIPRRASGYLQKGNQFEGAPFVDVSVLYAAGGLYSTVEDLLKWDRALFSSQLLSKELSEKMLAPNLDHYGYGVKTGAVMLDGLHAFKFAAHGGQIFGFSNFMVHFVDGDNLIVLLCNGGARPKRAHLEIAKILYGISDDEPNGSYPSDVAFSKKDPEFDTDEDGSKSGQLSREALEAFVGTYQMQGGKTLTFFIQDGHLVGKPSGQRPADLFPLSPNRFFLKVVAAELEFNSNSQGQVESVTFFQNGKSRTGKRIQ